MLFFTKICRVCPRASAPEVEPPALQKVPDIEQRPKRRLSVPPRFKCRVCNKIYLGSFTSIEIFFERLLNTFFVIFQGDKKMSRHVKLFPGHGPSHDPSIGGDVNQQLSALSVVPIIPIAR